MDRKSLVLLSLSLITLILTTSGITYAYLNVGAVQKEENVLSTACFDVDFNDENSTSINYLGYPMSDNRGLKTTPYTFTITNKCDTSTNYDLVLNVKSTTDEKLLSYIKYSVDGNTAKTLSDVVTLPDDVDKTGIQKSYKLGSGTLDSTNKNKTYNLYLWINDTGGNDLMGKKFEAEVMVYTSMGASL